MPAEEMTVGDMLSVFQTLHRKRKVRIKINGQATMRVTKVTLDESADGELVVIEVEGQAHGRGT